MWDRRRLQQDCIKIDVFQDSMCEGTNYEVVYLLATGDEMTDSDFAEAKSWLLSHLEGFIPDNGNV